jgi:TRAP-type uncharacterized transport system fused permease subunit
MVAIMLVPALTRIGVSTEAAHMFAFYFAVFAAVTPPAAEAAQVASRIADTSFWRTANASMRLMVGPVLIPFIFVYHTSLLGLGASTYDLLIPLAAWAVGTVALTAFMQRHGVTQAGPLHLLLFGLSAAMVVTSVVWNEALWLIGGTILLLATFGLQSIGAARVRPDAITNG